MSETCELLEDSSALSIMSQNNLPSEVIEHVLSCFPPSSQKTFYSAALVSRAWYSTAVKYLYQSPILSGKNFDLFVRSVCPSINAHVRYNGLADLIRRLDMSGLVHNGSRSLTARLIGRAKHHLDEFTAPQASFGVNSLAAISKCKQLRCLDLGFVSEAILMSDLLRSIRGLENLVLLYLPRASSSRTTNKEPTENKYAIWPPRLRGLYLNGAFTFQNMPFLERLPPSISELGFAGSQFDFIDHLKPFLDGIGPQLESLKVNITTRNIRALLFMSAISQGCRNLRKLCVDIELIGKMWESCHNPVSYLPLPSVERLQIGCVEEHSDADVDNYLLHMSRYVFGEKAPKLRTLLIHRKLRWMETEQRSQQVAEVNDLLKALAREDGESAQILEDQAGVVFFGSQ